MPAADRALIQEHEKLFFPDGDIVFFAGTCSVTAFCLHREIVNHWSPKFHSMLDSLDNEPDPLTYKGCCVIELDEDVIGFEWLVRAMYHGTTSLPNKCISETFSCLSSVLLLSQKYCIKDLFNYVRAPILAAYPLTLSSWDIREAYEFTVTAGRTRLESVRRQAPPLAVVSLALQLDAPHLLVPAYLDLARLPVSEIVRGFTTTSPLLNHPAGVTLHLRPKQISAVLRGKETLQRFIADFIKSDVEFRAPAPQCRYLNGNLGTIPSPCAIAFAQVAHEMLVMTADVTSGVDSDPLFVLCCAMDILTKDDGSQGQGACMACANWFQYSVGAARQHIWMCLDKWFDLRKVLDCGFEAGGWE